MEVEDCRRPAKTYCKQERGGKGRIRGEGKGEGNGGGRGDGKGKKETQYR